MSKRFNNWSEFYQQINLVFNAIIAASLLPFGWLMLEMEGKGQKQPLTQVMITEIVLISGVLMIVMVVGLAIKSAKSKIQDVDVNLSVSDKVATFYKIYLGYYLKVGTAALIAFAGAYFTRSYVFVTCYVAILFFLSFIRPTYDLVVTRLQMKPDERAEVESEEDFA